VSGGFKRCNALAVSDVGVCAVSNKPFYDILVREDTADTKRVNEYHFGR
jgi:hypothetical protein